jgi:hypothetical protein
MKPLFVTYVCDFCDGLTPDDADYDHGFVVWRGRPMPTEEYVFSTRDDAERWRAVQGLVDCPIREVLSPMKFRWRTSSGTVKGLKMVERPVTIYPDRRFPHGPNRAFLAAC